MSYPEKYKKRTIEYRQEGHTLEETKKTFKVSVSTLLKWEKQLKEEGNLKSKTPIRTWKKIDPEKLRAYVAQHPNAYQKEIAEEFHCCQAAVHKALNRLKITRKKRRSHTKSKITTK